MKKKYLLVISVSLILLLLLAYIIRSKLFVTNYHLTNTNQDTPVQTVINNKNESKLNWGNSAGKFDSINEILQINVYDIVVNLYENKECGMNRMKQIENIDLKIDNTNFSDEGGILQDYFITVGIKSDWWKDDALIILVFIYNEGEYRLAYEYLHGLAKPMNVNLMDIDTDTKSEIVIEEDFSGNQAMDNTVRILKYNGSEFVTIFEEGLSQCCGTFPYSYANSYQFVRNKENPKLFDIVFSVKTVIDDDLMNEFDDDYTFPKPINDQVIFTFNGQRYLSNKEVENYRKPFMDYYQ